MSSSLEIDKFIYQPRNSENGRIKDYELYFSKDGKNWENKTKGRFENSSSAQFVTLEKPIVARYFKLIALSRNLWSGLGFGSRIKCQCSP